MKKFIIIGIGDVNFGDDGIGSILIKKLKKLPYFLKKTTLVEYNKKIFDIIEYIKPKKVVLIIDATNMKKKPGKSKIFKLNNIKKKYTKKFSFHQFGLIESLMLAKSVGIDVNNVYIMGIQPQKIVFNAGLSDVLKENLPKYIEKIKEFIKNKERGVSRTP